MVHMCEYAGPTGSVPQPIVLSGFLDSSRDMDIHGKLQIGVVASGAAEVIWKWHASHSDVVKVHGSEGPLTGSRADVPNGRLEAG